MASASPRHEAGLARRRLCRTFARTAGILGCAGLLALSAASPAAAAAPGLGTAGSFAVLGGSTVTNTGPSVLSGDLGVSPGTAITGFPPGQVVNGTTHAADAVADKAQTDLVTAYNDAAGRAKTADISADLGGTTLTAGVYNSAGEIKLTGDLKLDAQGDPNAVFIFQAGSTLTVASNSRVLLQGGAQACNVFWQVGSSATIGTGSAFVGNILALTAITLNTNATLDGRALARNAAVTLDTNNVTKSLCGTPPVAQPTSAQTAAGQPVTVQLRSTNTGGAPVTYAIASGPSAGTLGPVDQSSGTVVYTPAAGASGKDSFTYTASNAFGTSAPATASIAVSPAGAGAGAPPNSTPAGAGADAQPNPPPAGSGPPAAVVAAPADAQAEASAGPAPAEAGLPAAATGLPVGTAVKKKAPATSTPFVRATLRVPRICGKGSGMVSVRGRGIRRVDFLVDGRRIARVTRRDRSGNYRTRVRVTRRQAGRVSARVVFTKASGARSRILRLSVRRCKVVRVIPSYTG